VVIKAAWWSDRPTVARVVELTTHDMRNAFHGGGLINAPLAVVTASIMATARRLDVRLNPHDAVMSKIGNAVGHMAAKVEASASNGTLSEFNEQFRRRRLEAQRTGNGSRATAIVEQLRKLMGEAAATGENASPVMFDKVFGG
jgi:hypothetical protein